MAGCGATARKEQGARSACYHFRTHVARELCYAPGLVAMCV